MHLTPKGKPYAGVTWNEKGEQTISWKEDVIAIVAEKLGLIQKINRSNINKILVKQTI